MSLWQGRGLLGCCLLCMLALGVSKSLQLPCVCRVNGSAYCAGARVTVLDRRHDYTRSIWFDLEAPAQTLLRKLGAAPLVETLGGVQQEGGIVTVQCLRLERFLSTMLALMAVNIVHGATFLSLRQREAVVDVGCGSDVACGSLALAASVTKPRGCAAACTFYCCG